MQFAIDKHLYQLQVMANEQRKPIIILIKSSENIPHLADLSSIDRVATLHQYHLLLQQFKNLSRRFGKLLEINFDRLADPDEIEDCVDEYRKWEAESAKVLEPIKDTVNKPIITMTQITQESQKCQQENAALSKKCKQEECLAKSQSGVCLQTTDNTLKTVPLSQSQEDNKTSESGSQDPSSSQSTPEEEETKEPTAKRFKTQQTQELNLEELH